MNKKKEICQLINFQIDREVPADEEFVCPPHYRQDLRSYQKYCRCLAYR